MIRSCLAAASVIILIVASLPSEATSRAVPSKAGPSKVARAAAAAPKLPAEIRMPSAVGEVLFRHQMHIGDLGIKCAECHHQINAKPLNTPHPDYFSSSWINCKTCHEEAERIARKAYICSECHETRPKNIADETLSAKVVIHKQCWKCHGVGTGKEASKGCEKCHSGERRP
jgi:Zn finger protein HypA/HybF involved in hydrogenase expression